MNDSSANLVRSLVVATDFSPAADGAVEHAALLAKRWNAQLTLLHVFNDGIWSQIKALYAGQPWTAVTPADAALIRLTQQAQALTERGGGIKVQAQVRSGRASTEIAAFCRETQPQLIVIGEHGENWLSDIVLGGTALKVLKSAQLPVLLARRTVVSPWSRVLIATDFSENAGRVARIAMQWFPDAHLQLVHAYSVAFEGRMRLAGTMSHDITLYRQREADRAKQKRQEQVRAMQLGPRLGSLLVHGHPAAALPDQAQRLQADLIVIGKHGASALDQRLLGSVTHNLLYHAPCDVLVVP